MWGFIHSWRRIEMLDQALRDSRASSLLNLQNRTAVKDLNTVLFSREDGEHVGLCAEFPSLSWLAPTPEAALAGIRKTVAGVVADMKRNREDIPVPLAEKAYSGQFKVRIPPQVHRALAMQAAEEGIRLNRLASAKLAATR
jgi:predicted HicB family RNase H-like nuclease